MRSARAHTHGTISSLVSDRDLLNGDFNVIGNHRADGRVTLVDQPMDRCKGAARFVRAGAVLGDQLTDTWGLFTLTAARRQTAERPWRALSPHQLRD